MAIESPKLYGLFDDPLNENIFEQAKLAKVDEMMLREALEEYPEYFWPDPEGKPIVHFFNFATGQEEVAFMVNINSLPDPLYQSIQARLPKDQDSAA